MQSEPNRIASRRVYGKVGGTHVSNLSSLFRTLDRGNDHRLRGRFSAERSSDDYQRFAGQCSGGLSGSEDRSLRNGLQRKRNCSREWNPSGHDLFEWWSAGVCAHERGPRSAENTTDFCGYEQF